ncbi:hypothetical protein ACH5RR_029048, partial [Cinchona calisaya]
IGKPNETFANNETTLLSTLSQKASLAPKSFATGEANLGNSSGKLFGLVECTRYLSSALCKNCIDATIQVLLEADVGTEEEFLLAKDKDLVKGRILSFEECVTKESKTEDWASSGSRAVLVDEVLLKSLIEKIFKMMTSAVQSHVAAGEERAKKCFDKKQWSEMNFKLIENTKAIYNLGQTIDDMGRRHVISLVENQNLQQKLAKENFCCY